MKFLLSLFLLSFTILNAQNIAIPDDDFKNYLINNSNINTDGDTEISVVEAEAFNGTIDIDTQFINDITGIENFINITRLDCGWNRLTNLDLSNNLKISRLECLVNKLTSLNLGNNTNLTYLDCDNNDLIDLDLSGVLNLEDLECASNKIDVIDLSNNTLLETIEIRNNELTSIDLSNNLVLRDLGCENNMIENIDISLNTKLTSIDCQSNNLNSLNLDNGNTLFFNLMKANDNTNLTCIQVDNLANVRTETWDYDEDVNFSTNCNYTLNLTEYDSLENTIIYQDSSTDFINIKSDETIESLKIYDINGRLVKIINEPSRFNSSHMTKGLYLFNFKNKDKFTSKKFVLK